VWHGCVTEADVMRALLSLSMSGFRAVARLIDGSRRPDSNRGPFHYECGSVRERRRQATTNGQRTRRKASALRVTRAHRWAVVAGEIYVFYTSAARCPVLDLAHR
jgi:hypothetical protein